MFCGQSLPAAQMVQLNMILGSTCWVEVILDAGLAVQMSAQASDFLQTIALAESRRLHVCFRPEMI